MTQVNLAERLGIDLGLAPVRAGEIGSPTEHPEAVLHWFLFTGAARGDVSIADNDLVARQLKATGTNCEGTLRMLRRALLHGRRSH